MNADTIKLLFNLLPVAEKVVLAIGKTIVELDVSGVTKEDLIKTIDASKGENWPKLRFISAAETQESAKTS